MSNINYADYSYPNTPFVFDKIYPTAIYQPREDDKGNKITGGPWTEAEEYLALKDNVFITRYILIEDYTNSNGQKEYGVVFQKRIDKGVWDDQPYYKRIVALDYSNKAEDHMNKIVYGKETGNSTNYEEDSFYGKLISDTTQLDTLLQNYTENGVLVWKDLDATEEATN